MEDNAVLSCPPPGVPVEMKTPTYLPQYPPVCRRLAFEVEDSISTHGPNPTSLVPEGLPLRRKITISRRNAEKESIVLHY
jgi:hypothetical protein